MGGTALPQCFEVTLLLEGRWLPPCQLERSRSGTSALDLAAAAVVGLCLSSALSRGELHEANQQGPHREELEGTLEGRRRTRPRPCLGGTLKLYKAAGPHRRHVAARPRALARWRLKSWRSKLYLAVASVKGVLVRGALRCILQVMFLHALGALISVRLQ